MRLAAYASSLGVGGERKAMRLFACHCEVKLDGNILAVPPQHPSCRVSAICAHVLTVAHVPWLCHLLSGGTFS